MLFCFHCPQDPSFRSESHLSSPVRVRHHPLIILSSFLSVITSVQGRRGPTLDTFEFSDVTPCNPVTFSWTGGFSPFSILIVNYNNDNILQEFDGIEGDSFVWTPPQLFDLLDNRFFHSADQSSHFGPFDHNQRACWLPKLAIAYGQPNQFSPTSVSLDHVDDHLIPSQLIPSSLSIPVKNINHVAT
ncbi:hypothetical protein V8D89_000949 [Ganoderma adspersum]